MKTYLQKHSKIKYSDHWSTPLEIYHQYVTLAGFHDPCPLYGDEFTFNEIDKDVFLNPPYSDISRLIDWAIENHKRFPKRRVVILIPSRTDTKYFHKLLEYGVDLEFVKGRLEFGGRKTGAPFPSVLVHINAQKD